jgi:hypothetical protein
LRGLFGLSQRIERQPAYRVRIDAVAAKPVHLYVRVCERHLLYDGRCQIAFMGVPSASAGPSSVQSPLRGPALNVASWLAPRYVVFEISIHDACGAVDLRHVAFTGTGSAKHFANCDFSEGLAHWQTVVQSGFLPWHVDNLYLELLIERGLPAMIAFVALTVFALRRMVAGVPVSSFTPFVATSLVGALLVGVVGSMFDVPRIAFLVQLLILFSLVEADAVTIRNTE